MNPTEPDDRFDALLRSAVNDEAETVMPAGDGLSKIQQRVAARRSRQRWLRPALALGSAVVVAAIGIGAYAAVHGDNATVKVQPNTHSPSPTQSTSATPSTTTPPVPVASFPRLALYPFTTAAQARVWQAAYTNGGHQPLYTDPKGTALNWMANWVQHPEVNQVVQTKLSGGNTALVTLGRTVSAEGNRTISVTTVRLVKYGDAWIVVGAGDPAGLLKFAAPKAGAQVSSPVQVTGPAYGVDQTGPVEVRGADQPTVYGTTHTSWGNGRPWSTSVSFSTPSAPVGMIVVVEGSAVDSGPQRIAVEQVRFASSSVQAGSVPTYFYGIKNNRVTQFHSSDGSSVAYLTTPPSGGGDNDPQLVGGYVYFVRAGSACTSSLMKVSTATSASTQPTVVATPDAGYVIAGYAIGATVGNQTWVSYYETACGNPAMSPQAKLVTTNPAGQKHAIDFQGQPPQVVGNPSFEPVAKVQYLDAVVNTGHQSSLVRYRPMSDTNATPGRNACPGFDPTTAEPWALQTDVNGVIWFAVQTGGSIAVEKCMAGGNTALVAFSLNANGSPSDIAVTANGGVLVTDTDGHIWRWNGTGSSPVQLSPSQPLLEATW